MVLRGANPKPIAPRRGANPKPIARLGSAIRGPYLRPNRNRVVGVVGVVRAGRIVRAAARRLAPRRQPEANPPSRLGAVTGADPIRTRARLPARSQSTAASPRR